MVKKVHAIFLLSFCVLMIFSCRKPGVVVGFKAEDFNIEEQILIGKELKENIEANSAAFQILDENDYPEANNYLRTLLNTLLFTPLVQHRTAFDWDISIVQNDTLKTVFALPGGHIYVYTGFLKLLNSEHELLGVLAHEMHYADTDLMVQRIKAAFGGVVLGDIILGNQVQGLAGMVEEIPYMDFTEEEVLGADTYATNIMCLFQYAPSGIIDVIERINSSQEDVQWLQNRFCEISTRIENFNLLIENCEIGVTTNESNYYKFKTSYLP